VRDRFPRCRIGLLGRVAAAGWSALIAVACSDAAPPPAAAPPAPPAQAAVTVPATPAAPEPAPVSLQADTYTYNPAGRRDPFQSLIVSGGKRSLEFLPPLQRREVSELRLVAVVWGSLGTYGLLEMPDGKGYAVRVGTPVGPNHGVVKRITTKDLTVGERYVDFFGATRTREIVLELRSREEGLE
jgi:type IV pilus assembly protein PilP